MRTVNVPTWASSREQTTYCQEVLPWSWLRHNLLSLEEPSCPVLGLLGMDHIVLGPACRHKSTERTAREGAMGGGSPTSPTYTLLLRGPCSGWPSLQLTHSLQLPVSWAPHSRPGCLAAIHRESSCLDSWDGAGQAFTACPGIVFRARSH